MTRPKSLQVHVSFELAERVRNAAERRDIIKRSDLFRLVTVLILSQKLKVIFCWRRKRIPRKASIQFWRH